MKTITFEVSPQGKIRVEADGFQGPECEEEIRKLIQNLGTVTSVEAKPEYYNSVKQEGWNTVK